ncbi:Helicase C-terminal [Penicillium lagena]|uniref:Helicase C-terminal n=1 Tax=Penicillium lagena TaxID=94218 RepID=UPI0025407F8D|nr:Helicase C-terminal [Penicillium lagena]KAJ5601093.1 Helicase C-terminal [Penicillium lagena]
MSNGLQFSGGETSLEIARRQSYQVAPLAGHKRAAATNAPYNGDDVLLESMPLEAARASSPPSGRFSASRIHPGPGEQRENQQRATPVAAAAPGSSKNPLLLLSNPRYGLPPALTANFAALGVNRIYPWQASCLLARGLLSGERHLVYTAPTGGGKSLVADVLLLKRVIENPTRKAILVLPYVALVQEKLKWLRHIVENVEKHLPAQDEDDHSFPPRKWKKLEKSIRVTGFFGGSRTTATWADTDIAVCTIEKANSLINSAIEECSIGDLGVVVLDELHMLDDEHRGYLLELMVTKLLLLQQDIQIVGMSATLSNTEMLAQWINAKFYISNYRPVPIDEYLVYENAIYPAATSRQLFQTASKLTTAMSTSLHNTIPPQRLIDPSSFKELSNAATNAMVALAVETAAGGYGALVFCGSRQGCQIHAATISEAMPSPAETDELGKRLDLLAELRSLSCGLDPVLQSTIIKGTGFHHAGMTTEERELIAHAYDHGVLRVLVATCSLAAGVNLPARRVIINGARMGRELVGPAMLRQMCGRAGRKGKDDAGETYLICVKADLEAVCDLLDADMPAIESCLAPEKRGLKRALLEAIATGLVSGCEAIKEYVRCTLLWRTLDKKLVYSIMKSALQELIDEQLLVLKEDEAYEATQLGQAVVASAFSPEDGLFVHEELKRALRAFVMDGDLHVFYMFTPLQATTGMPIDWQIFRDQLDRLDESGLRALQFIGVQPGFVNTMSVSITVSFLFNMNRILIPDRVQSGASLKETTPEQFNQARIYRRAYTAFQLRDISNEVPLSTIAQRYRIPRGTVQTLAQQCHGFAAGIVKFCQRMNWGMLATVLDHMRDRLEAGARADLLEMAQVTYVKSWTARLLRDNGFPNLRALAEANPKDLVPVLMMVNPRKTRESQLYPTEAERYSAKLLAKAETIVGSATKIWGSKAIHIRLSQHQLPLIHKVTKHNIRCTAIQALAERCVSSNTPFAHRGVSVGSGVAVRNINTGDVEIEVMVDEIHSAISGRTGWSVDAAVREGGVGHVLSTPRGGEGITKLGDVDIVTIRQEEGQDLVRVRIEPALDGLQRACIFEPAGGVAQLQDAVIRDGVVGLGLQVPDAHIQLRGNVDILILLGQGPDESRVVRAHKGYVRVGPITEVGIAVADSRCGRGR